MTSTVKRNFAFPLPFAAPVPFQGRVRECANLVGPGKRLLDVGCSSAWLAPLVLERGVEEYVGLDRRIAGATNLDPRISLSEGSAFDLPFGDAAFDAVCLFDVVEHLPRNSELSVLHEARRVLRPGGKLYFSTPHASWLHTPLDPVWYFGHRHYRRATVKRLLTATGFRPDQLFVAGGLVEVMDHLRLLLYKHILHRHPPRMPIMTNLINSSHGRDHWLGMTVFAVATR